MKLPSYTIYNMHGAERGWQWKIHMQNYSERVHCAYGKLCIQLCKESVAFSKLLTHIHTCTLNTHTVASTFSYEGDVDVRWKVSVNWIWQRYYAILISFKFAILMRYKNELCTKPHVHAAHGYYGYPEYCPQEKSYTQQYRESEKEKKNRVTSQNPLRENLFHTFCGRKYLDAHTHRRRSKCLWLSVCPNYFHLFSIKWCRTLDLVWMIYDAWEAAAVR